MDQWKYLLVKDFDGNFLLDTRITFGGVAGCGSFGRPADAWKLIMKSHFKLLNIFRWVDDNLFVRLQGENISMEDIQLRAANYCTSRVRMVKTFWEDPASLGARESPA
ncbi:hypothetical protein PGT21_028285 [Puccinia graminis f. sp. tritici]|uniref:Reverse transcriptase domain-containing protein n=1 Tax=Puccinia graminis f. sp. tritici TaxID=56615 RepID=A0A5B0M6Y4_PUCGR|nr:hypothetical protein PGT21_028285 [Puccinia graminis f. sp. tritici]